MNNPRITVVIPTINQARYLERTICSVLDQGYANTEIIVVDGGSRDGTAAILRRYEEDLTHTIHHARATISELVNRALLTATGDVVAVLPAGDLLLPFAMTRVAERFEASDRPSWIVSGTLSVDAADRLIERPATHAPANLRDLLAGIVEPVPFAACFYSRELLDEAGPLRAEFGPQSEFEYTCRLLAAGHAPTPLNQTLSCHRSYMHVATQDRLVRQREFSQIVVEYTAVLEAVENAARHRRNRHKSRAA